MANVVLIEKLTNGSTRQISLAEFQTFIVDPSATYSLLDLNTMEPIEGVELKRKDEDLELEIDGEVVARLEEFYVDTSTASFVADATDIAGSLYTYTTSAAAAAGGGISAGSTALIIGGVALGIVAATNNDSGRPTYFPDLPQETIEPASVAITPVAGELISVLTVEVYDQDGNLLTTEEHDFSTGPYVASVTNGYVGPILVIVKDTNDVGDYIDEATNVLKNLGGDLRAMSSIGEEGVKEISVTPLTELAVRHAGITGTQVSEANLESNNVISTLFGITDITGPVVAVTEDDFDDTDGVSDAEKYGNALAILSGSDSETGGVDQTLDVLLASISTDTATGEVTLSQTATELLNTGAVVFSEGENAAKSTTASSVLTTVVAEADTTAPTLTITDDTAGTATGAVLYTFTFSEAVTGFTAADIAITGGTAGTFTKISATKYTLSVTPNANSLTPITVDVAAGVAADSAANNNTAATQSVQAVDTAPPDDNALPEIIDVQVDADGNVAVTYSELVSSSVLEAGDFEVTVNNVPGYEITGIAVSGAVVTLITAVKLAPDVHGGVRYTAANGTADSIVDIRGNAALDQFFTDFTMSYDEIAAVSSVSGEIAKVGTEGNDSIIGQLTDLWTSTTFVTGPSSSPFTVTTSTNAIVNLSIQGLAGDDTIGFNMTNSGISTNTLVLEGGAGDDAIDLNFLAEVWIGGEGEGEGTYGEAYVYSNDISIDGGSGDNSLFFGINGQSAQFTDTTSNFTFVSTSDTSLWTTSGGFFTSSTITVTSTSSPLSVSSNTIAINGGAGIDTITFDVSAAAFYFNNVAINAGDGADVLDVDLTLSNNWNTLFVAEGEGEGEGVFSAGEGEAEGNSFVINADGGDDILNANISALFNFSSNTISLDAGTGDDTLFLGIQGVTFESEGEGDFVATSDTSLWTTFGGFFTTTTVSTTTMDIDYNTISVVGGAGIDNITFDFAGYRFYSNTFDVSGGDGNDLINLDFSADYFSYDSLIVNGGSGDDTIDVDYVVTTTVYSNNITLDGGPGNDLVSLTFSPTSEDTTFYLMSSNTINLIGGTGNDQLTFEWLMSGINVNDYVWGNEITLSGGDGSDDLHFDWDNGFQTDSTIYSNIIVLDGGDGDDTLTLDWWLEGNTYSDIYSNTFEMFGGGGNDILIMNLTSSSLGTTSSAGANLSNVYRMEGGSGDDAVTLNWHLNAGESGTAGLIYNNEIVLQGNSGTDILNFNFFATDTTSGSGSGSGTGTFSGNLVDLNAGTGDDTINLNIDSAGLFDNIFVLDGGAGDDVFDINVTASSSSGNVFVLLYETTTASPSGTNGDSISGLTAGDTIVFAFADNFMGSPVAVGSGNFIAGTDPVALDADDHWLYNSSTFALYFDPDGTGSADAIKIAQFTNDIGITANDLYLTSTVESAFFGP